MSREETLKLCAAVLQLSPPPLVDWRGSVALIIFPGGGNEATSALRFEVPWWEFTREVWVAGTRGDPTHTNEDVRERLEHQGQLPSPMYNQGYVEGLNTKGQMAWVVAMLLAHKEITHVILSTAEYHVVRCFLTFLKAWLSNPEKRELAISVLPSLNPNTEMTTGVIGTNTSLVAEYERIEEYQAQGDVATAEEFKSFSEK